MLWALPLLPLAGAVLGALSRRRPRAVAWVCLGSVALTLLLGVWAAAGTRTASFSWGPMLELRLETVGFSQVMVVLVPAVALPILAYAVATEREGRTRLLALMVGFVGAMQLLVAAADFLTLLIGWELIGAVSWALIGHGWQDPDNPRFASHAFITTRFGDLGLYVAAGLAFAATGSFTFADLAGAGRPLLNGIAAGVLVAAATKSAQVPFAPWLFSAMAGPTPVSALLHSATLVAAGAYALVRLAPHLGAVSWFLPAVAAVGLATALSGGVVAILQTHPKRVLAGSTSAQYGLMFLGVGAGSAAAAGAHLVTHAAFKSLLFLGAGVAIHAAGSARLADMRLGRALPGVALVSGVGALALAAVPPLGGAWTKEQIVSAAVHASGWLGIGTFAAAFLSAAYAARYQLLAYGPGSADRALQHRPGRVELAALGVLAGLTVGLSLLWLPAAAPLAEAATLGVLIEPAAWELPAGVVVIVSAFGVVWWLWRRDWLVTLGLPDGRKAVLADWLGLPAAARIVIIEPVLALSAALARVDDRVIDGGVRAVVAGTRLLSRLAWRRGEWTFDGAVRGIAAVTMATAAGSRTADDRGVDVAVEGLAGGVGVVGERSRALQTGLSHHYYVLIGVGLVAGVVLLALLR